MRAGEGQMNWTNPPPALGLSWVQGSVPLKAGIRAWEFMEIFLRLTESLIGSSLNALNMLPEGWGKRSKGGKTPPRHFRSLLNPLLQASKNWRRHQYREIAWATESQNWGWKEKRTPQWLQSSWSGCRSEISHGSEGWELGEQRVNYFWISQVLRSHIMLREKF